MGPPALWFVLSDQGLERDHLPDDVRENDRNTIVSRSVTKNRGRLDTVAEILNTCVGGANKSRVMLMANVNSLVATEILGKLAVSGLVTVTKVGSCVTYGTTNDGLNFVEQYTRLVSKLCPGLVPQTRLSETGRPAGSWI